MQIAMDSPYNHYEQQLYAVFKSFDVCGEEALERSAVINLCNALQLEARGETLVDELFFSRAERVTFAQFRAALLRLLGAKDAETPPTKDVLNDLSDQELAPKIVFGKKKYGRRSRPQRAVSDSHLPSSSQRTSIVRSASAMAEYTDSKLNHDSIIIFEQALELCNSLHMDSIDPQLIQSIFDGATSMTLGEFFQRLDFSLSSTILNKNEHQTVVMEGNDCLNEFESPVDQIVEIWEQVGIQSPLELLHSLGFNSNTIDLNQLERTLNLELRMQAVNKTVDNEQTVLLYATLALAQMLFGKAHSLCAVTAAERDKLRADLSEANTRTSMLAHEIDENHTRLESDLKKYCQQLEMKHANETKNLKDEWFAERERHTTALSYLQKEILEHTTIKSQQQSEIQSLKKSEQEALQRCTEAEQQIAYIKSDNNSLQNQLATLKETVSNFQATAKDSVAEAVVMQRLTEENKILRDRVDELVSALESRQVAGSVPVLNVTAASLHDEALNEGLQLSFIQDDSVSCSLAGSGLVTTTSTGVQTDPFQLTGSHSELPNNDREQIENSEISKTAQNLKVENDVQPSFKNDAEVQVSIKFESEEMITFRRKLEEKELAHIQKVDGLQDMIDELEKSLELMKEEYDKCEEYWSGVVEEERARAAPTVSTPSGALPPIEERSQLEAQVTDLEQEHADYKHNAEAQLEEKQRLVEELQERIKQLELQVSSQVEQDMLDGPETNQRNRETQGDCEMFIDKLVASDLLVKDLFIENCRLYAAIAHNKF